MRSNPETLGRGERDHKLKNCGLSLPPRLSGMVMAANERGGCRGREQEIRKVFGAATGKLWNKNWNRLFRLGIN